MLTGWHFLSDEQPQTVRFPASTFLDVAGVTPGMSSGERLVRLYFKGRPKPAEIAQRAIAWHTQGCRVQLANEPNLPMEEFGGTAEDYAAWFTQVKALVKAQNPDVRLYWAGMSPGMPEWWKWYQGAWIADGIAAHAYGNYDQMRAVVESLIPIGKPIWLAEVNFGAGNQVERDAWARDHLRPFLDWCGGQPLVDAVTYFAYTWPTPDMHTPTPVDGKGTAIEGELAAFLARQSRPQPVEEKPVSVDNVSISRAAADAEGVDADLFERLCRQESGFAEPVVTGARASSAGAVGIAQLMPDVARALGLRVDDQVDERTDAEKCARAGARYLAEKLRTYRGDVVRALIAYNGGHGAVQAWEADDPAAESVEYVAAIQGVDLRATLADPCEVQFGGSFKASLTTAEQALAWIPSACGPIALAGALTRLGKPTRAVDVLRSAFTYRHPDGRELWNAQDGMVGAYAGEAMETLAREWGVKLTRVEPSQFYDALGAGGGIIDAERHYLYAIRPSTTDRDLLVGNTGTALLKGAEWMSLDAIADAAGPVVCCWVCELEAEPNDFPAADPITAAEDAVWAALSELGATDQAAAVDAQRQFATVIKPILARAKEAA